MSDLRRSGDLVRDDEREEEFDICVQLATTLDRDTVREMLAAYLVEMADLRVFGVHIDSRTWFPR